MKLNKYRSALFRKDFKNNFGSSQGSRVCLAFLDNDFHLNPFLVNDSIFKMHLEMHLQKTVLVKVKLSCRDKETPK